jgi:tryptophanyl-tRNA synthetase
MEPPQKNNVALTADRPSGPLHLGHYIGSLITRVKMQDEYECFVMVADVQALAANFSNPQKIRESIREICKDYLAVGIDPNKTTIFLQSAVPELCELTIYYANLISVARLERNPTVKSELQHKDFADAITAGFLIHPVSQAADITAIKAQYVPVGEDQLPLIEVSNEIVRKFNRIYNTDILKESKAILSKTQRLVGIDGKAKASKSLNNAIFLSDSSETIKQKIQSMYTDPNHIKISDPGKVAGNVVFAYLDAFFQDEEELKSLKKQYKKGGLGDGTLKSLLNETLQLLLDPIREQRKTIINETVDAVLTKGNIGARAIASQTLKEVRKAIGL